MPALAAQVRGSNAVVPMEMLPLSAGRFVERSSRVGQPKLDSPGFCGGLVMRWWVVWL